MITSKPPILELEDKTEWFLLIDRPYGYFSSERYMEHWNAQNYTINRFLGLYKKSPCFRSRSPWKLDSVGRIIFLFWIIFFILCRPLIQMNTQDMHAPKHHCMQHIAKSQTWHCYIARCMWSKLHTEKTKVSDNGQRPKRHSRIRTVF